MSINNEDFEQIKEIREFPLQINRYYFTSDYEKFILLKKDYDIFKKKLESIYDKWFPNAKECKDEEIVNQLLKYSHSIEEKDRRNWVKHSLCCLKKSSNRIFEYATKLMDGNHNDVFLREINFLKNMSSNAIVFLEQAYEIVEGKSLDFEYYSTFSLNPRETFDASKQFLREHISDNTIGYAAMSPTSIFLIRQSIETWLQSIFGIDLLTDGRQTKIEKLQTGDLFYLLKKKKVEVQIPVSKSVIEKIYDWTNGYIHSGKYPYLWEIEHAQHVLKPIFNPENIKIKESEFKKIEEELRICKKNPNLVIQKKEPFSKPISD